MALYPAMTKEIGYYAFALSLIENITPDQAMRYFTCPDITLRDARLQGVTTKDLYEMKQALNLSYGQLAKLTGLKPNTIAVRIIKYREKLKAMSE